MASAINQPKAQEWRLLVLMVLLWPVLTHAAVTASLDRQTLYEGDSLNLTIESTGQKPQGEPDLTPLAVDFDILGTSRGTQVSIINGRASRSQQWRITLTPKRLGALEIPSLNIGDEHTQALSIQVMEAPQGALGHPGDEVFIELTLERLDGEPADAPVLVQQHLPLVVRLYSALPLRGGTLSDPRAEGAVLERLGPDQRYRSTRNGREYQVIERRYSLSPERSGELRIPPVVFEGELLAGSGRAGANQAQRSRLDRLFQDVPFASDFATSPLSLFESGEPVRAQSRALTLEVTARPQEFTGGHWLPAEALTVTDSWAEQPPQLRVGEPLTRTLTLTAKGLAGSQIPDVDMQVPESVRAYREPSEHQTRTDGQAVYAISRQAMTLIPTQPGQLVLPELRIRWWDVQAGHARETQVPALTLTVIGAAQTNALSPSASSEPAGMRPESNAEAPEQTPQIDPVQPQETDISFGRLLSAALALLALAAAGVWRLMRWRKLRQVLATGCNKASRPAESVPAVRPQVLRAAVRQAAIANDPSRTAEALLALGRALWPEDPPLNLGLMTQRLGHLNPQAQAALQELERALYAPDATVWSGAALWEGVAPLLGPAVTRRSVSEDSLPPLYPTRH